MINKKTNAKIEKMKEDGDVLGLMSLFKNSKYDVCRKASLILQEMGDLAVDYLLQALNDWRKLYEGQQLSYFGWVARTITSIGDKRAFEPLVEALKDKNPLIRQHAADVICDLGDSRALEPLINMLNEDDWSLRSTVVKALGRIGDVEAVPYILRVLNDEDDYVQTCAIHALGKFKDKELAKPLIQVFKDNPNLRDSLERTLSRIMNRSITLHLFYDEVFTEEAAPKRKNFKSLICSHCGWKIKYNSNIESEKKKAISQARYHANNQQHIISEKHTSLEQDIYVPVNRLGEDSPQKPKNASNSFIPLLKPLCWIVVIFVVGIMITAQNYEVPYTVTGGHLEYVEDPTGGVAGEVWVWDKEYEYENVPWWVQAGTNYQMITIIIGIFALYYGIKIHWYD